MKYLNSTASNLINIFEQHRTVDEKMWEKYSISEKQLILLGDKVLDDVLDAFCNHPNENVILYMIRILKKIGNEKTCRTLENYEVIVKRVKVCHVAIAGGALNAITAIKSRVNTAQLYKELKNVPTVQLIENLYLSLEENYLKQYCSSLILTERGPGDLLEYVNSQKKIEQFMLPSLLNIICEFSSADFLPFIKSLLKREDLWSVNRRLAAIYLLLNDEPQGLKILKLMSLDPKFPFDVQLLTLELLYYLGLKDVFASSEVHFSPEDDISGDIHLVARNELLRRLTF